MLLPNNIPLAAESIQQLEALRVADRPTTQLHSGLLLDTAHQYLDQYMDQIIQDNNNNNNNNNNNSNGNNNNNNTLLEHLDALEKLIAAHESLLESERHSDLFNTQFDQAKRTLRVRARDQRELTVANMDTFETTSAEPSFSDLVSRRITLGTSTSNSRSTTALTRFVKNASFVLHNPTAPLPDDEEDEDDLAVKGGTVDLKCPITLQLFKDPYASTVCSHVFDKSAIQDTFSSKSDCPMPGCPHAMRADDFERDPLMLLRVAVWQRQQRQKEAQKKESYTRV
jgi:hypothetical protein